MPKIFISYRREDSEHVTGRIHDRLEPRFGRENVFLDVDTIPFGVDFREHLDRAVSKCDILLAVIGDRWLDIRFQGGARQGQRRLDDPGDFVRIEIESALKRGIPVIPLLVDRATMPGQQELPEGLRQLVFRNAAEVRSGRDFHAHVERLIGGIEYLVSLEGPVGSVPKGSQATSPLEEVGQDPTSLRRQEEEKLERERLRLQQEKEDRERQQREERERQEKVAREQKEKVERERLRLQQEKEERERQEKLERKRLLLQQGERALALLVRLALNRSGGQKLTDADKEPSRNNLFLARRASEGNSFPRLRVGL